MTSLVIEECWKRIFEAFVDIKKDFILIHTKQIKKFAKKDLRLLTKFDTYESQPEIFKKYHYFLLPLQNRGNFVLIRGKGFESLQYIYKKPKVHVSKLGYTLETSKIGISEPQYINYAFNTGLIESYLNMPGLYLSLIGKKRTPSFKFKVGNMDFTVGSVIMEIDAGFENKENIVLLEAKIGEQKSFNIRQIYYPFRSLNEWISNKLIANKLITNIFFTFNQNNGIYSLFKYEFEDKFRYDSIKLVKKDFFIITTQPDETLSLDEIAAIEEGAEAVSHEIDIPQADDFDKVSKFPFAINEGYDDSNKISSYFEFTPRQSSYYRHAAESLGLVKSRKNKYFLTDLGKKYIDLPTVERNSLLASQLIKLPVIELVLNEVSRSKLKEINLNKIAELLERNTKYNITTSKRRAMTIFSWFKWIADVLGILKIDGKKILLK